MYSFQPGLLQGWAFDYRELCLLVLGDGLKNGCFISRREARGFNGL